MNLRRVAEPVVFGILANVLVNILIRPDKPAFLFAEFVTAILLAIPITEINRFINRRLELQYNWTNKPIQRFLLHFLYLLVSLVILLNVTGNAFLWITGTGFFPLGKLLLINLVTVLIALLLTTFNWAIDFYQRWAIAETAVKDSRNEINLLKLQLNKSADLIELQKGTTKFRVEAGSIRLAIHKAGFVKVFTQKNEQGIFNGTLTELEERLPQHLFFQATRNAIVHRDIITSVAAAAYGKLILTFKEPSVKNNELVVSRLKAASFRRWYSNASMQ